MRFQKASTMNDYSIKTGIKYWAEEDRPREKLMHKGKGALSDAELLAILIGSGSPSESAVELSRRILQANSNNLQELGRCSVDELMQYKGIGEAKAISIVAAMELGRRYRAAKEGKYQYIKSSRDAYNLLSPLLSDRQQEAFFVILLNQANRVLSTESISEGSSKATIVDKKKIFHLALTRHASSIILSHNHPSGQLKPSQMDINITKDTKKAGQYLDINVLDHIIIGNNTYYSFADEGQL